MQPLKRILFRFRWTLEIEIRWKCKIFQENVEDTKRVILTRKSNSAILQLYHGENKLIFNEMMMRSALY